MASSSSITTELDEVAMTYARSLYELAHKQGGNEKVLLIGEQIAAMAGLSASNPGMREFLSSRIIAAKAKKASLQKILASQFDPLLQHFILLLNDKGRLGHLAQIARAYDKAQQEAAGRVEVTVFTARGMDEGQLSTLRGQIQARLGREPIMTAKVEPAMLGGIRLQIGDKLIDASLQSRLRKVAQTLTENGLPAVRAASERVFA
jgi:F-type H+-transporting ATPase subunit delta